MMDLMQDNETLLAKMQVVAKGLARSFPIRPWADYDDYCQEAMKALIVLIDKHDGTLPPRIRAPYLIRVMKAAMADLSNPKRQEYTRVLGQSELPPIGRWDDSKHPSLELEALRDVTNEDEENWVNAYLHANGDYSTMARLLRLSGYKSACRGWQLRLGRIRKKLLGRSG